MGNAGQAGKAFINLPRRQARAARNREGIRDAAVYQECCTIGLLVAFHEIADTVADKRHEVVGQRRDGQFADAAGVNIQHFEESSLETWLHVAKKRGHSCRQRSISRGRGRGPRRHGRWGGAADRNVPALSMSRWPVSVEP